MRALGGWIALTPELRVKLLFGRHVWDCAQHADLWGRRLPELRAAAQQSEPASDGVVRFLDLLERPEARQQTPERVVGVYRVLKPHLATLYHRHLAAANPVYEPPTRRILERCLTEERRHAAAGAVVLEALVREPAARARAEAWERELLAALGAARGVTGDVDGALVDGPVPDLAPEVVGQDLVAVPEGSRRRLPESLETAVAEHARALVAGDLAQAAGQVVDTARPAVVAGYSPLARPWRDWEVIAHARVGAYRVVRVRLAGAGGAAAVVQLRWKPASDGWSLVAAELVRSEAPG